MQKTIKNLLSSHGGTLLPAALNVISIMFALRGIVKSKSSFWSILNMVSAGVSGYMLFKTVKTAIRKY